MLISNLRGLMVWPGWLLGFLGVSHINTLPLESGVVLVSVIEGWEVKCYIIRVLPGGFESGLLFPLDEELLCITQLALVAPLRASIRSWCSMREVSIEAVLFSPGFKASVEDLSLTVGLGWYALECCSLMPNWVKKCFQKWLKKRGSGSEVTVFGSEMKWANFERRSTITQMAVFPCDGGRCVMKSIVMSCHGFEGIEECFDSDTRGIGGDVERLIEIGKGEGHELGHGVFQVRITVRFDINWIGIREKWDSMVMRRGGGRPRGGSKSVLYWSSKALIVRSSCCMGLGGVRVGGEFEDHVSAGDWKNKKGNVGGEFVDFEWCVGKEVIVFQELAVADHNGEGCNGCWFGGDKAMVAGVDFGFAVRAGVTGFGSGLGVEYKECGRNIFGGRGWVCGGGGDGRGGGGACRTCVRRGGMVRSIMKAPNDSSQFEMASLPRS
nr:hypothetical protein [Tanacetum cinerariifolium]